MNRARGLDRPFRRGLARERSEALQVAAKEALQGPVSRTREEWRKGPSRVTVSRDRLEGCIEEPSKRTVERGVSRDRLKGLHRQQQSRGISRGVV
jgi:hypothetical protein